MQHGETLRRLATSCQCVQGWGGSTAISNLEDVFACFCDVFHTIGYNWSSRFSGVVMHFLVFFSVLSCHASCKTVECLHHFLDFRGNLPDALATHQVKEHNQHDTHIYRTQVSYSLFAPSHVGSSAAMVAATFLTRAFKCPNIEANKIFLF